MIDEGLAIAREHTINFYGPELLRLRGRLGDLESAREAAAWSRRLGARTLELRALVDIARHDAPARAELAALRGAFADTARKAVVTA